MNALPNIPSFVHDAPIVLYSIIKERLPDEKLSYYLERIPYPMQLKISAYRRWQDAQASLIGKLLLEEGLKIFGSIYSLSDIKLDSYKRPYVDPSLDFNISHSNQLVICALSRSTIGVDVEEIANIDPQDYRDVWNEMEWRYLVEDSQNMGRFFDYWTKKEAASKAYGCGFLIPPREIMLLGSFAMINSKKFYFNEMKIKPGYKAMLATDRPIAKIQVLRRDFE